jgi:hypothetical protein
LWAGPGLNQRPPLPKTANERELETRMDAKTNPTADGRRLRFCGLGRLLKSRTLSALGLVFQYLGKALISQAQICVYLRSSAVRLVSGFLQVAVRWGQVNCRREGRGITSGLRQIPTPSSIICPPLTYPHFHPHWLITWRQLPIVSQFSSVGRRRKHCSAHTTVNDDLGGMHIGRVVRREKKDYFGNLFGFTKTA